MLIENNKIRWGIIAFAGLLSVWWILPNFVDTQKWWIAKEKLIYGLDIQGGLHLVMGVNIEDVLSIKKLRIKNTIVELLDEADITVKDHKISNRGYIVLRLKNPRQKDKAVNVIEKEYGTQIPILSSNRGLMELDYSQIYKDELKRQLIDQSIEVIRNRVDEFGVSEPLITAQGSDRILVQLPGVKEAKRAKDLIRKTAHLQMRLVSDKISTEKLYELIAKAERQGSYSIETIKSYRKYIRRVNKDLKNSLPKDTKVVFSKDETSRTLAAGLVPVLLELNKGISGSSISDASVGSGQFGQPIVNFTISVEGRKTFFDLTSNNIDRLLAVVLDDVVKSAPSINGAIFDRGQIELGRGDRTSALQEATDLSITLRAGALPTTLEQLEERTVGPTLGQDLISKGKYAGLLAIALVIFFLLIFYKTLGLVANISLFFNVTLLISFLTSFGATLTLPGVAGIILTVGMAVDANIIIFERLKEELRKGASVKLAVQEGFGRAFSAILDANITTAIVCLVLMYFGTGPIRGFAITLLFGIITSVFTAIFVSRTILNSIILIFKPKSI